MDFFSSAPFSTLPARTCTLVVSVWISLYTADNPGSDFLSTLIGANLSLRNSGFSNSYMVARRSLKEDLRLAEMTVSKLTLPSSNVLMSSRVYLTFLSLAMHGSIELSVMLSKTSPAMDNGSFFLNLLAFVLAFSSSQVSRACWAVSAAYWTFFSPISKPCLVLLIILAILFLAVTMLLTVVLASSAISETLAWTA